MLAGFIGATGEYDIDQDAELEPEEQQIEVEYCLRLKGFCVLHSGLEDAPLREALEDIDSLREDSGKIGFIPTPPQVLDGVLGPQGSGEFCELGFLGAAEYTDGAGLKVAQETMGYFTDIATEFCKEAGFLNVVPSPTLAMRGAEPDIPHELNEGTCMSWLSTFKLAKLMLVLFLGPNEGTLELQPYDEEAGSVEIKTQPGMLVILRYDALMRNHICTRDDYALVRWIWARDTTGPRGWRTMALGLQRKMPALRELFDWARDRMQHLLNLEDEYGMEGSGVTPSREWELLMHHNFFKKDRIPAALRGVGGHLPGPWDPENYWKLTNEGCDLVSKVPFSRWDHDLYFDADPDCWMKASTASGLPTSGRTSVRHASFMDGIELFDNKFFGLSISESKGMDPQQRHILETSYECLSMCGYKKKELMNSEIGVYIGTTNPEVNYIEKEEVGACSGTGSAVAITSNRISFQLGLMGPSSSVECGMSSASMAIRVGVSAIIPHHEHRWKTGGLSPAVVAGGIFFSVSPFMWPRFNWGMDPAGRCFTFDSKGNGYVRGEAAATLCLVPYAELVDSQWTVPDRHCLGTIVGSSGTSNGRCASLTAPSGPMMAATVFEACREAHINPLDLDGLDCHGVGGLLEDSVEVQAAAGVLRGMKGGSEEVLAMGSNKTHVGAMMEACGTVALFKVFFNIVYGTQAPSLHLRQLNPHIELSEEAVVFNTESMAYRERTSFHAQNSSGSYTGMNVAIVTWYMVDELKVRRDVTDLEREVFSFWPGGGGALEGPALPQLGYFIVGSWTKWEEPEEMVQDGPGSYVYTVTLGPNRFESFQVWLDGESERVLHPGSCRGMPGDRVQGPVDASKAWGYAWVIEGRSTVYPYRLQNPEGRVGDRYQVRLAVSGKYRTVTWKLLPAEDGEEVPVVDAGTYYVAGDWRGPKTVFEMRPSEEVPGLHAAVVTLPLQQSAVNFVIVRDQDWGQTFYPMEPEAGASQDSGQILGPEDCPDEYAWQLSGRAGESFRIEFQRHFESGDELRRVSWRSLG